MYRVGIDLGGTNIVAGVVDENYKVLATSKTDTKAPRSAQEIADDMAAVAFDAVKAAGITMDDVDYFGIGTPGIVSADSGTVVFSCNLDFHNVDLAFMMKQRTGKEFYIENDASAAAYGEFIAGSGKGAQNFIAVTLGTGIGGGIIINGKLYSGLNGAGGELGHMVIKENGESCTCGRKGCWETYASATALVRETKQAMLNDPQSIMWQLCQGDIDKVNGKTAFDAARSLDAAGEAVVERYIEYLAVGVTNLVNIFQPDMICIGGGISHERDYLIKPLCDIVDRENYARSNDIKTVIKAADLGNNAGIIGAAYLFQLHR